MASLPNEIWVQILDYLEPLDLLKCQRVSTLMLELARDTSLWRSKCFEHAPSAVHAFSSGNPDSLTDLFNGLSIIGPLQEAQYQDTNAEQNGPISRRAKAITKWDCTDASENVDWFSEYIARHAPLSIEWLRHPKGNEIRSMALFDSDEKVFSAMEDGSLRVWDVATSASGRRSLRQSGHSPTGLLFSDLSSPSASSTFKKRPTVGTAVDSTVVDPFRNMAYVAVGNVLNEIDLNTMQLVSQNKYAWNITATSQVAGPDTPLMIGTSFSLQMHDPRLSLRYQADHTDHRLNMTKEEQNIVILEDHNKSENSAWVEPGPQAILHHGLNEIIIAGRMPSILFYDKRFFPQLQYSIHSGARLSSITTLPFAPNGSKTAAGGATLIAAGEYRGPGSLELYELPHRRPHDLGFRRQHCDHSVPERESSAGISTAKQTPPVAIQPSGDIDVESSNINRDETATPFSYRNRQSASNAKILSVATQGARIIFSDGDGSLRWVERDGRGLARRWNINSYEYTQAGGAVVGEAVAHKILTFSSDRAHDQGNEKSTRGNGDLLIWTGSDIGIVTTKVKWTGHDELVRAFEEKMHLGDGARSKREQEEQYSRIMRQALERQADERRFLARFGRTGGW